MNDKSDMNALAELAKWMDGQVDAFPVTSNQFPDQDTQDKINARKVQRIVAELAKYGNVTPPFLNMKSVFENCRAIAKE